MPIRATTPVTESLSCQSSSPILSIDFADAEAIRARKVVTRSRARPTGKFPSWKVGRMIQWESSHELNAFRLLDANPAVRTFREQPCEIRYMLNGEERLHFPDALVELEGIKEIWEVKTKKDAGDTDVVERTLLLEHALPNHGYQYKVVIAEDLQRQPRLANALQVLRFGRAQMSDTDREHLRLIFARTSSFTWGAVLDDAFGRLGRNHVCRLLLEGVLTFDIEQALTRGTILHCTDASSWSQRVGA